MPEQLDESRAIFRWLADELSPDTYVNIMAQYRPAHEVGSVAAVGRRDAGTIRYPTINRRPFAPEIADAYEAARTAGLWRFDDRGHVRARG
jgi:putative pyruvate formate lyase activating enzyme